MVMYKESAMKGHELVRKHGIRGASNMLFGTL
jgi:hypothetical protein